MRRLIYIPIIHTETDMGSVSEDMKKEYLARYGKNNWLEHLKLIAHLWDTISERLTAMPLDYGKTRLYQDGLPVCGKEADIVRELAAMESKNHLLLMELMEKGATLMGTESPDLLIQELGNIKEMVGELGKRTGKEGLAANRLVSNGLLTKRDHYIAARIADTLMEGETGILFIGAMHKVGKSLPKDIRIVYLT
ncbi:MAG TPA: hypothetical protein VEM32_07765 [Geobacteraceae bacterium]|nr:hypothetical protein [Geobacteraceae bacterium]